MLPYYKTPLSYVDTFIYLDKLSKFIFRDKRNRKCNPKLFSRDAPNQAATCPIAAHLYPKPIYKGFKKKKKPIYKAMASTYLLPYPLPLTPPPAFASRCRVPMASAAPLGTWAVPAFSSKYFQNLNLT
jgi:hypothetical protein